MKIRKRKILKPILISFICIVICVPLVLMPTATFIIYESIFGVRYDPSPWNTLSAEDFDGLIVEKAQIAVNDDKELAAFKYSRADMTHKGVIIVAHGLGGGGHTPYLPLIDAFARGGYYVFAYDATANGDTDGSSVEGFPQGIIDLEHAIKYVMQAPEYKGLPLTLFGHSWGAYSTASVLGLYPEIEAAIVVAGFNESEDLILYQGEKYVGSTASLTTPYVSLYERLKFTKKYADLSAVESMETTDAGVMIVHSADDATVPTEYGYDKFYAEFSDDERFEFVLYENRGHSNMFYSDASREYRRNLEESYEEYVESNGLKYNDTTKTEFMSANLNKALYFELDTALITQMLSFYDEYCTK
ncbi:MAG: alpha/beta fold hydrolase [Ruminococcaceae bacterium]|nr:alpha/beta fold hydrolase [Oscillospiraceae bacterium]